MSNESLIKPAAYGGYPLLIDPILNQNAPHRLRYRNYPVNTSTILNLKTERVMNMKINAAGNNQPAPVIPDQGKQSYHMSVRSVGMHDIDIMRLNISPYLRGGKDIPFTSQFEKCDFNAKFAGPIAYFTVLPACQIIFHVPFHQLLHELQRLALTTHAIYYAYRYEAHAVQSYCLTAFSHNLAYFKNA